MRLAKHNSRHLERSAAESKDPVKFTSAIESWDRGPDLALSGCVTSSTALRVAKFRSE